MYKRDFLSVGDITREEIEKVFEWAKVSKEKGELPKVLEGEVWALVFEKPSLRTRVTFSVGVYQLGGEVIYLSPQDIGLGKRESVKDVARNLSLWVDGIIVRTFAHEVVEELAQHASVPVINALTDEEHPAQVVADLFTMYEVVGELKGKVLAYVGDGNNVCQSLILGTKLMDMRMHIATPVGYEPKLEYVKRGNAMVFHDPRAAVEGVDFVYTDVWASMGKESEREVRRKVFAEYQVNEELMGLAPNAYFMHCLPAHRGEEVTDGVIDGARSLVLRQAENRLHVQKGLMILMKG